MWIHMHAYMYTHKQTVSQHTSSAVLHVIWVRALYEGSSSCVGVYNSNPLFYTNVSMDDKYETRERVCVCVYAWSELDIGRNSVNFAT